MNNVNKSIVFGGKNIFPTNVKNKILKRILFENMRYEPKYRHGSEHHDYEKHSDYSDHDEHYDTYSDHSDHNDHNS